MATSSGELPRVHRRVAISEMDFSVTLPLDAGDVERRIAEGLIPARPDYVRDPEEWRRWYDEHIRCATPEHTTFLRARGSKLCPLCLAKEVP